MSPEMQAFLASAVLGFVVATLINSWVNRICKSIEKGSGADESLTPKPTKPGGSLQGVSAWGCQLPDEPVLKGPDANMRYPMAHTYPWLKR
jgi:hypothetical protein